MDKTELRYIGGLSLRRQGGDSYVDGYVVRYADRFRAGRFTERIVRGALKPADRFAVNLQHNPSDVLGVYPQGVDIGEDDHGVTITVRVPDTDVGRRAVNELEEGILNGFSVEMPRSSIKATLENRVRTIRSALIGGVGLVSVPAYEKSSAQLRSAFDALDEDTTSQEPVELVYGLVEP